MRVAFYKRDRTFFGRLISWWTRSEYTHVELVFGDGMFFSAHPADGGTRYKKFDLSDLSHWDFYELPTLPTEEGEMRAFCDGEVGCRYDWFGIFLAQVLGLNRQHPDWWFCSEVCTAAFQRIGRFTRHRACWYSPHRFFDAFIGAGGFKTTFFHQ